MRKNRVVFDLIVMPTYSQRTARDLCNASKFNQLVEHPPALVLDAFADYTYQWGLDRPFVATLLAWCLADPTRLDSPARVSRYARPNHPALDILVRLLVRPDQPIPGLEAFADAVFERVPYKDALDGLLKGVMVDPPTARRALLFLRRCRNKKISTALLNEIKAKAQAWDEVASV